MASAITAMGLEKAGKRKPRLFLRRRLRLATDLFFLLSDIYQTVSPVTTVIKRIYMQKL
jgi:hypothetical protein